MSQQDARLYWIDAQIRANHYPNPQKVAGHFGVTERTAFNDYGHLRNVLHAPVRTRRGEGWYYSDPTYMLPFLALSETEADALRRSLLAAEEYLGEADAQVAGLLLERLAPHMPPGGPTESMSGSIHLASSVLVDRALLQACRKAVRNRQKLWLRYWGAYKNAESERIVNPYRVHYFLGEPHLIAWSEADNEIRQFFLPRTRAWELLEGDRAFVWEPGFDIDAYLSRGLGAHHGEEPMRLRVRFTPYQARWIRERRYHASQQNEELPDGALIVTMHVAGRDEVRRWVQGFGSEAEVLEPEILRQEMAATAKKLLEIYGAPPE